MILIPLVSPLLNSEQCSALFFRSSSHLVPDLNPKPRISISGSSINNTSALPPRCMLCCSNRTEKPGENCSDELLEVEGEPSVLRPWDVPWDWKVTLFVMMPYLLSIAFTGIVQSTGMAGAKHPSSDNMLSELQSTDELAIQMFMDQLLKDVAKLSILYMFVSQHQPLPDDIFSLRWKHPLNLQYGWVLWAATGLLIASFTVFLVKAFISTSSTGQTQIETESIVRLLPLIGSSNVSTICLLGIVGILAPVSEEAVYRGFLLTSLTKWFPLPVSLVLSSAVFTLGHQSPGKSLEIFIFGIILGLVYTKTRNLLAPIAMHACWNSGVILLLNYLLSQGHDIQKYVL